MKRGKPYQSSLKAYTDEIMALRNTVPKTPYHKIATYLKAQYGLEVSHNAVWSFVTRRTKIKRIIKRARSLDAPALPSVNLTSLREKIRAKSEPTPTPKKWNIPEL